MDFFARQDEARRRSVRYTVLAVFVCILTTVLAALVFSIAAETYFCVKRPSVKHYILNDNRELIPYDDSGAITQGEFIRGVFSTDLLVPSSLIAFVIIFIGFLIRLTGCTKVTEFLPKLGAKQIFRVGLHRNDPLTLAKLRLFNVCEEMAIAAGIDLPTIWLLEEDEGINAFVAGKDPAHAALCVSMGALRHLERDELQGVVAHEFSHVLNGDMRFNFRLLVMIAGITAFRFLGECVFELFRGLGHYRVRLPRSRGKNGGSGGLIILILFVVGVLMWVLGSIGALAARMMQSAASREREFLADASATQFTRNPIALASALQLAYLVPSQFSSPWRADVAHMLFSDSSERLFATHPSVHERIKRLSGGNGEFSPAVSARAQAILKARPMRSSSRYRRSSTSTSSSSFAFSSTTSHNKPSIFTPSPTFAARLRDPREAGAVLMELLRDQTPRACDHPLKPDEKRQVALRCVNTIRDASSVAVCENWIRTLTEAIQADGKITSFEFMILALIRRRLRRSPAKAEVRASFLRTEVAQTIATLAQLGEKPAEGYLAAEKRLSLFGGPLPPQPAPCQNAEAFFEILSRLEALPSLAKQELMFALKETVASDGVVSAREGDQLAAVADAIGAYGWNI